MLDYPGEVWLVLRLTPTGMAIEQAFYTERDARGYCLEQATAEAIGAAHQWRDGPARYGDELLRLFAPGGDPCRDWEPVFRVQPVEVEP